MKERSRARGWALQAMYAWESRNAGADELMLTFDDLARRLRISPRNRLYAEILLQLVANNLALADRTIRANLTNWSFARLSVIDRNILRLGVIELLFVDDVPPLVTIREMMHLAERYGTDESARFVNGVLDGVMRGLEASETTG